MTILTTPHDLAVCIAREERAASDARCFPSRDAHRRLAALYRNRLDRHDRVGAARLATVGLA